MYKNLLNCLLLVVISSSVSSKDEEICKSVDIRNNVSMFQKSLENCTVIEGYLQILLIDGNPEDFEKLHFPKLVEVTDYVLLYRVNGMRTLRNIFPNLTVIRGKKLFFDYALVGYEMFGLEEVGLVSLTTITRGAVRFEDNPKLCFLKTVDWNKIAPNGIHHFRNNPTSDNCPAEADCPGRCPTEENDGKVVKHCWTKRDCQKICPDNCRDACYYPPGSNQPKCCHRECLGTCNGSALHQCAACKHVNIRGTCVAKCGQGLLEYEGRRCINIYECKSFGDRYGIRKINWKMHDGKCIRECPVGFITDPQDPYRCIQCPGKCPKECTQAGVNSVSDAERLKGCTIINGDLTLNVMGGKNIATYLEEGLGMIEEITGSLQVSHSYALYSLDILRSLKRIRGNTLKNDKYALYILDNQNLREIWNTTLHPKLTVDKGKMFFHFNRRLCLSKINELKDSITFGTNVSMDEVDISLSSNGDQATCSVQRMAIELVKTATVAAVIAFDNFKPSDPRTLLSYVINYRETSEKNVSILSGRDACSDDVWMTKEREPNLNDMQPQLMEYLFPLKPWTLYAVYVQTYTIAVADKGAISNIMYFTTRPDSPTPAVDVEVEATMEGELTVTWKPPNKPNGNVTHYMVYWTIAEINKEEYDDRNYCIDTLQAQHLDVTTNEKETEQEKKPNITGVCDRETCCACPKSEKATKEDERNRNMQIEFENFLHGAVYIKRPENQNEVNETEETTKRLKRETHQRYVRDQIEKDDLGYKKKELEKLEKLLEEVKRELNENMGKENEYPLNKISRRHKREFERTFPRNSDQLPPTNETSEDVTSVSPTSSSTVVPHNHTDAVYKTSTVYGGTRIVLPNLKHFTFYRIEIIACQEYDETTRKKLCSSKAIANKRTRASRMADRVDSVKVVVNSSQEVLFLWSDPPTPNGVLLTYTITYQNVLQPEEVKSPCIPHKKYREIGGYRAKGKLTPGNWSVKVCSTSLAGTSNDSCSDLHYFIVPKPAAADTFMSPVNIAIISVSVVIVVVIVVITSGVLFVKYRLKKNQLPVDALYTSCNPEYLSAGDVYIPDEWEVDRDKISLIRELGQGSFGMVYEGIAKEIVEGEPQVRVAVKTVNENASIRDRIEFLNEASVMKAFNCHHVVKLLGVVSKGQPTLVIMELMAVGDLKNFLRKHRPDEPDNEGRQPPDLPEILRMTGEIADGMAYLSAKKFVHRDLAARNCMVSDNMTVKIGDFGMTRDIYETDYYRKGGKGLLPVRWMAPESLKDGIFTNASDVWSFGVVLWEMSTLAAQPYQGFANEQVLKYVIDGHIIPKPDGCPDKLYKIMLKCWKYYPKQRPTFCQILEHLSQDLPDSFHAVSFFDSEENAYQSTHEDTWGDDDEVFENSPGARRRQTASDYMEADYSQQPLTDPHGSSQQETDSGEEDIHINLSNINITENHLENHSDTESKSGKSVSCECIKQTLQNEMKKRRRSSGTNSTNIPYPSAINSNEGSKGSSKSSSSGGGGYAHMNGLVNGHINVHLPTQSTQC
ncbi:insulin receptor isoform X2 [Lingula anatina]|uniref:Tyrosine-protein kinase receptor n=1 Tax=Lingula anatina TaxID=7574 RepID=A0A1S3HB10_LINAN|nr:insulin receptor isoform X2 [Lingula anatina]|eukprot:XP_013383193.1 insulin receptor isoform X2 [Lingula anatina]